MRVQRAGNKTIFKAATTRAVCRVADGVTVDQAGVSFREAEPIGLVPGEAGPLAIGARMRMPCAQSTVSSPMDDQANANRRASRSDEMVQRRTVSNKPADTRASPTSGMCVRPDGPSGGLQGGMPSRSPHVSCVATTSLT